MERSREGKRGASGPPRSRVSGPKDRLDDEARMDEAPPLERAKKEKLGTFHVSLSATATARSKKKRQGLPAAQALLGRVSGAEESTEETENAPSEEDEDEPPPPAFKLLGKSRTNGRVKEDEIVMDIPAIPRKARSASSRFSSALRRQPEPLSVDTPRQQALTASQQRSPSPSLHAKLGKRLKPAGTKIRPMKDFRLSGATTISDQEVEVAEALFDLARSMPSHVQASESMFEQKSGITVSLHLQNATHPAAEAPKRKRARVASRQEGDIPTTSSDMVGVGGASCISPFGMMHSSMVEANQACLLETNQMVSDENSSQQPEPSKGEVVTGFPDGGPRLHGAEDRNASHLEQRSNEHAEDRNASHLEQRSNEHAAGKTMEDNVKNNADMQEQIPVQDGLIVKSPAIPKPEVCAHVSSEGEKNPEIPSRITEGQDAKITSPKIDLMAPTPKVSSKGEGESDMQSDNGEHAPLKSSSIISRSHPGKAPQINSEKAIEGHKGLGVLETEIKDESSPLREKADDWNQEHSEQKFSPLKEEQKSRGLVDDKKDNDAMIPGLSKDQEAASVCLPVSSSAPATYVSSSTPVALGGWIGGFPPPGYYGTSAPWWPAGASLPGSSIDGKTSHPAMQLPHAAVLPYIPRMKRCATHVYAAYYIQRQQQCSRQACWPPALPTGAPYDLSTLPASLHGKEHKHANLTNVLTQQAGPAFSYTVSQSIAPGMLSNSDSLNNLKTENGVSGSSHSTNGVSVGAGTGTAPGNAVTGTALGNGVSVGAGTGTAPGNAVTMAAHAQYVQAMMQQNGFASLSLPFNGSPGQVAPVFYPAHLMPPVPHLQALMPQQTSNLLPLPKHQQGLHSLPHMSLSQALSPPPHPQQQLQLLAPEASQQQQQQHYVTTSLQHLGAGSQEDGTLEGESQSTPENGVSALHRSLFGQGPSASIPNLNISPSSLMLTTSMPALRPDNQDGTMLGGKQSIKPHQQKRFQGQQAASPSSSVHQQQLTLQNTRPGSRLKMKGLDPSLSEGYPLLGMPSMDKSTVGPGQLDLVVLPGFSGASENARINAQQQQSLGPQNQQYYQRSLPRVTATSSDKNYHNKELDFLEENKSSMKQGGGPFNLGRVDAEVHFPSGPGSSTCGGGAPTIQALNKSSGRSSNLETVLGARIPSSTSQVPHLQNQIPKQAMARVKPVPATSISPATSASIPAYIEKIPGQMAPSSQGIIQGQTGTIKTGQRPLVSIGSSLSSTSQGQQAWTNLQGACPRMLHNGSAPVLSSGMLSLSTSHIPLAPKVSGVSTSKSPLSGKGIAPTIRPRPATIKRSTADGPTLSSVMGLGQSMSAKVPVQSKRQGQVAEPQVSQQQSTASQLGTKQQLHHSPPTQLFFHQHQQFMQHSSSQQQASPLKIQQLSSQYIQPNSQSSPHQQQLHSVPLSVPSNMTLGAGFTSPEGANNEHQHKFQGSGARASPPLGASSPVSSVTSKNKSAVTGQQVSSPHSGPSHYLQIAPVMGMKSIE